MPSVHVELGHLEDDLEERRRFSFRFFRFIEVIRFIIHRACRERFLVHEFIGDMDELHLVTQSLDVLDQVASD